MRMLLRRSESGEDTCFTSLPNLRKHVKVLLPRGKSIKEACFFRIRVSLNEEILFHLIAKLHEA